MRKRIVRKVVYISGGFNPFKEPSIMNRLESLTQGDEQEIILDFKDLNYMHFQSGILLETLKSKLKSRGKNLRLKNVSSYFLTVLNLSGYNWKSDLTK
ncbi:STAS domain-containing protein [candidate division WOR-3 bacterium]|nr:STAS domain-containing protein [candidate division WOR-3 bacterium]